MKKFTNFVNSWSVKTVLTVSVLSVVICASRAASNRYSPVDKDTVKIGDVRAVETKITGSAALETEMMRDEANEKELSQVLVKWVALSSYWNSEDHEMTMSEENTTEVEASSDNRSISEALSSDDLDLIQFHAENFIAESEF